MNVEPRTPEEWADWLADEQRRRFQHFCDYPEYLVTEGTHEREVAGDYAGREVLELLQNANDAAADAGLHGRVRIELSAAGLLVANVGAPFTREGVASLKLANFSPKRSRKRQVIGNKGLGFRAVLNWTRNPLVFSEGLALAFSAAAALAQQERLAEYSDELRQIIAREQQSIGALIVPVLAFPGFRSDGDIGRMLDNGAQRALHDRARELQAKGFSTVIAMPFASAGAAVIEARKQLAQLRPEVLLFAPSVQELEIVEAGKPAVRWRHDPHGAEGSRVYVNETEERSWRIFRRDGTVPKRFCAPDRPGGMDYEIVVAVPTDHQPKESVLYSYFPTEMPFPYPVIAHATLDLQANRQQPQDDKPNHFILRRLARLMAEVATTTARERNDESGLLLLATTAFTDPLAKFNFRKMLCGFASQCRLVPTATEGLVKARVARRTKFADNGWLPKRHFANVAQVSDPRAAAVLEWIGVEELSSAEWMRLTANLEFETIIERADYIVGLVRHQLCDTMRWSGLLLDSAGRAVPANCKVFVGDATRGTFTLPTWFDARFLHDDLRKALLDRLQPQKQEHFITLLAPFDIASYSLSGILESLAAQARRRVEAEPERADEVRRELIGALYALFPADEPREARIQFPKSTVFLKTLAGSYEPARRIYLSEVYGPLGRVLQDLYGAFAPQKLLAPPEAQGLSGESEKLAEFFQWLGVADAPLKEALTRSEVENDFVTHVQHRLNYPLWISDFPFAKATDFRGHCTEVASLDELPKILEYAPPTAVLAWLATDTRAQTWKTLSPEHGKLHYDPGGRYYVRHYDGAIASYVRWKLQSTAWLPTRDGRFRPGNCLIETVSAISHLLPIPATPSSEELQRYGITRGHLIPAWDNAGVLPGFSHLDPDQLYDLLLSLPQRDPTGEAAKSVYEAVLRRHGDTDVHESEGRKRWMREGRIFALTGNTTSYRDVQTVLRLDASDLPAALRRTVSIAAVPKGVVGSEKIETLLGVRSVKPGEIVRRIRGHTPAADSIAAAKEVNDLKPLIRFLRKTDRAKRALERLQLELCSAITGEVEFRGQTVALEIGCWEWVFDDDTDTAFLLADPAEPEPLESPFFANAVGEIFAEVFELARGAEFAQLAQCRRREDRLPLLRKMLGDETVPGLEELERTLQEEMLRDQEMILPAEGLAPPRVVGPPHPAVGAQPEFPTVELTPRPLLIQSAAHTPRPAAAIALRVTRTLHAEDRSITTYERVRGDFCEAKVVEFEEQRGRFALHVGKITGFDASGVDVLSFSSAEQRAAFEAAERKDAMLVERFIEVKGRRDSGAKIDLRDNELSAARRFTNKYYIYRVFDRRDGTYAFAILQDPLRARGGRKRFYEVNLDSADDTRRFEVAGGLTKDAYLRALNAAAGMADPGTTHDL